MIVDAHLDLSMNALEWNRDLQLSVKEIREIEKHLVDKPDRGKATVSLPALRAGNIGLVVATQIARYVHRNNALPGWNSPQQAWAQTQGQLAWYRAMERAGELRPITDLTSLEAHLKDWKKDSTQCPIGFILSLEGADSLYDLALVESSYEQGLRAIGPAHYGPGTYAHGTDSEGGIGQKGEALLREMDRLGIILDATHLCDQSFWEAMKVFQGPVWASHSNVRALVPNHRQFEDAQIRHLLERGAVIGMPLDAWMMIPNWERGKSTPQATDVSLQTMVDHMDHICQLAGHAKQVGLGTDLDGGFGKEQCPYDLETIADLQTVPSLLKERGYSETDISGIMGENWLRFLKKTWA